VPQLQMALDWNVRAVHKEPSPCRSHPMAGTNSRPRAQQLTKESAMLSHALSLSTIFQDLDHPAVRLTELPLSAVN